jgi:hypothetical protein
MTYSLSRAGVMNPAMLPAAAAPITARTKSDFVRQD